MAVALKGLTRRLPLAWAEQSLRAAPQAPMVVALARTYCWQELVDSGKYASIAALTEALGVDRCYVRRNSPVLVPGLTAKCHHAEIWFRA